MLEIALVILRNPSLSTEATCSLMPHLCSRRSVYNTQPNLLDKPDLIPGELEMLQNPDPGVRSQIVRQVAVLGVREAVLPISRLLKDPDLQVRRTAGEGLFWMCVGELCDNTVAPSLFEALKDKTTRGSAVQALAYLKTAAGVEPVSAALSEDIAEDGMGLAEYWEANPQSLEDFLTKDKVKVLLQSYAQQGPVATRRKAEQFLSER
jgi:HEAT repeat protein